MRILLAILVLSSLVKFHRCEVTFESLCSSEAEVSGMSSIDGNDEFEIDLYDNKFLPEDTILLAIKQKRQNYGVHEFAIRAFDYDGNVIGRFDDRQTGNLALKHHTCPNGASVIYVDKLEGRGYREIPLAWKASGIDQHLDEIIFKADVISNRQLYRVKSSPLKRRMASGIIPYAADRSINIDYCGESQGCLIVPQQCNNDAKCEYALSWQVIDNDTAQFHIIGRAHGFVGVGFSNDDKRGDDQVVLCTKDVQGHVFLHHMFVGVQTPQYIYRERPSYGLRDTDGYSNATHIICKFTRRLSNNADSLGERDGTDRGKLVDLKQPHYMYPIFSDQDLMTPQGMRIPIQEIPIMNNHPINFERRIWAKSHPRAGSIFAKLHAILNIIAWILFASAGVMVARYFDSVWPVHERQPVIDGSSNAIREKAIPKRRFSYTMILTPLMFLVAVMTWLAFLFILIELDWKWTHGTHHLWHSILGVIVLVCAFFAPFVGLARPKGRSVGYCIWYWVHWIIVTLAHCLAIPVIFLGMDNRRLDLWTWCSWLLFGWCIFHTIVQLIFEIHACCYPPQKEYERVEGQGHPSEKNPKRRVKQEPATGGSWKPAVLGIYLAVTSIVVIILVIAVILYAGY